MIASKVKISNETRRALLNPVLGKKQKQALRLGRVIEKIRSTPGGSLTKQELLAVAGYDPNSGSQSYKNGIAYISNLVKRGILTHNNTRAYRKNWTVMSDVTIKTPPKQVAQSVVKPQQPTGQEIADGVSKLVSNLAKDFYWETGSNDLKEFVKFLSK